MFERFTQQARDVVVDAQEEARVLGHDEIIPEHILLAVLSDADSLGAGVLRQLGVDRDAVRVEVATLGSSDADALRAIGVDLEAVRRQAEAAFGPGALDRPRRRRSGLFRSVLMGGHLPFSSPAKKVLEQALREALALEHNYIGTEHILLGLLADDRGSVPHTLRRLATPVDPAAVRARVIETLRGAA
jgi:ATP-dependent Clp protease ATP-binding subunit ClpA